MLQNKCSVLGYRIKTYDSVLTKCGGGGMVSLTKETRLSIGCTVRFHRNTTKPIKTDIMGRVGSCWTGLGRPNSDFPLNYLEELNYMEELSSLVNDAIPSNAESL